MIKELRVKKGLTQKELADLIGKNEKYVEKLEDDFPLLIFF